MSGHARHMLATFLCMKLSVVCWFQMQQRTRSQQTIPSARMHRGLGPLLSRQAHSCCPQCDLQHDPLTAYCVFLYLSLHLHVQNRDISPHRQNLALVVERGAGFELLVSDIQISPWNLFAIWHKQHINSMTLIQYP